MEINTDAVILLTSSEDDEAANDDKEKRIAEHSDIHGFEYLKDIIEARASMRRKKRKKKNKKKCSQNAAFQSQDQVRVSFLLHFFLSELIVIILFWEILDSSNYWQKEDCAFCFSVLIFLKLLIVLKWLWCLSSQFEIFSVSLASKIERVLEMHDKITWFDFTLLLKKKINASSSCYINIFAYWLSFRLIPQQKNSNLDKQKLWR